MASANNKMTALVFAALAGCNLLVAAAAQAHELIFCCSPPI